MVRITDTGMIFQVSETKIDGGLIPQANLPSLADTGILVNHLGLSLKPKPLAYHSQRLTGKFTLAS